MNATVQTWRRDCGACPISWRRFLAGCASCAAGALTAVASGVPAAERAPRPKVRLVFSHHRQDAQGKQSEAGWPSPRRSAASSCSNSPAVPPTRL